MCWASRNGLESFPRPVNARLRQGARKFTKRARKSRRFWFLPGRTTRAWPFLWTHWRGWKSFRLREWKRATRKGVLYAAVIQEHVTELLDLDVILAGAAPAPAQPREWEPAGVRG